MSPTRQRRQRNNKNETSVSIYHLQCSSFLFCQYTAPLVCPLTEADFRHELRNKCRENWIWIFPGACLPHMMNAAGDFVQVRCVQTNRNISQTPCCILTWVHSGIFRKFYSEGGGEIEGKYLDLSACLRKPWCDRELLKLSPVTQWPSHSVKIS